jgi:hypothetical protein
MRFISRGAATTSDVVEDRAKRSREKTSSRERLQRPSTPVQLLEPTQKVAQKPRPPLFR